MTQKQMSNLKGLLTEVKNFFFFFFLLLYINGQEKKLNLLNIFKIILFQSDVNFSLTYISETLKDRHCMERTSSCKAAEGNKKSSFPSSQKGKFSL